MKNLISVSFLLILFSLTSCELVGDIFSAGFYTALILVVLVIAVIVFIVAKMRGKR